MSDMNVIEPLLRERDEARAEIERLRAARHPMHAENVKLRDEIEQLKAALREANTIILAARLYIPRSKDDDNGHGWARDADKWIARAALEKK